MPFQTLKLRPGINLEDSLLVDDFQANASNLVRFYAGMIQQLGGWQQKTAQTFVGICSGLHGWADIRGNPYLAIGTDERLQVLEAGTLIDVTPLAHTSNIAVSFSTVAASSTVTITDLTYPPGVGDWIYLATQVSVGGIVLFGYYLVTSIAPNSYTVTAASPAVSTVTNGGAVPSYTTINTQPVVRVTLANHGLVTGAIYNAVVATTIATILVSGIYNVTTIDANTFSIVGANAANANATASENAGNARIQYLLPSGLNAVTALTGYGIGDYGAGDYGIGPTGQILAPARQWSLDHWGQYLIASPSYGGIYYWVPPNVAPAVVVSGTAPTEVISLLVLTQAQIILALGVNIGPTLQPLLAQWCDAGDFTDWTPSAVNQAGSFPIPSGSILVGGLAVGLGAIIWTDIGPWTVTYIGFPLVFGFNPIANAGGLIAQRAAGATPSFVMWLSSGHQFFQYAFGGGAQAIECSVWDFYFFNVDKTQLSLIHCAVNSEFNELAWHFPMSTASPLWNPLAPFGYVKYNHVEKVWDYGLSSQYQRTASVDKSPVGAPIGADRDGLLQEHEIGYDANGATMLWSWQAGFVSEAEGKVFLFSDFLIPDFTVRGNQPTLIPIIQTTDFSSNSPPTDVVVQAISVGQTNFVTYAARGRGISFGFAADPSNHGSFCRLGAVRIRIQTDGEF